MEMSQAIMIGRELMLASLLLVAPVVIVSLVIGLFISIAQTVTSIQEQTLTFAPRIVAVVGVIILLTPWYLTTLKTFTLEMFERMSEVAFQ
jgi:flagellar biosynthetic protein FliQ